MRRRTRGVTGTISTPICAFSMRPVATKSWSRRLRTRPSGPRCTTGSGAPVPGSVGQRLLAGDQPREILQREQVGVDATHDALANEVLVLRRVEELKALFFDAVHPAEARRPALQRNLQGNGFEQRIIRENRAHLARMLDVGLVLTQELLYRLPSRQR